MTPLDRLLHERFLAFAARHAADLDDWSRAQLENIEARAEYHRRSLAQRVRQIRVRLYGDFGFGFRAEDPDAGAILRRQIANDLLPDPALLADWDFRVNNLYPKET